jgi:hypothetical protein
MGPFITAYYGNTRRPPALTSAVLARTPCGPRRPPTPWTGAPTWARSRSGSATPTCRPPGSTTGAAPGPKTAPLSMWGIEFEEFRSRSGTACQVLSPASVLAPAAQRLARKARSTYLPLFDTGTPRNCSPPSQNGQSRARTAQPVVRTLPAPRLSGQEKFDDRLGL